MRISRGWTVVSCLFVAAGSMANAETAAGEARVVELAPGVHAALQAREERFNDANSVFFIGEADVVLVDPPSAPAAVEALIAAIRERTSLPVRFVVNTHWHGDHTEGNAAIVEAFGDVVIVGHESLAADVPGRAATDHEDRRTRYETLLPQARQQLVDGLKTDGTPLADEDREAVQGGIRYVEKWLEEHADSTYLPPTLGYDRRAVLHQGSRRIELHHLRGHTLGDTVVYLPAERIVVSGDLLDELPYVGHGYPRAWIESLETLSGLDFVTIVPGHGDLFTDREPLDRELGFLRDLLAQVERAVADGMTLEQATERVDLSRWREVMAVDPTAERFFDAVLSEAIARAWTDVAGDLENEALPDG